QRITLIEGEGGLHALGAALSASAGNSTSAARHVMSLLKLQDTAVSDRVPFEQLYGTAGYLSALLFVRSLPGILGAAEGGGGLGGGGQFGDGGGRTCSNDAVAAAAGAAAAAVPDSAIRACLGRLVAEGARGAAEAGLQPPALMFEWHGSRYLGAAHGLAGIALAMMQGVRAIHGASSAAAAARGGGGGGGGGGILLPSPEREALEHARGTLRFLVSLQLPSGNFPSRPEAERDRLVQWCHGAPGVVLALAEGYGLFGDERFAAAAARGSDGIWRRGLLVKGNGLCHGVAGNAYAFLSLWRVTGDAKHLYRPHRFAEFAVSKAARRQQRVPAHPHSVL
ncbi:unnamed protein product, partial [Phaeothamnion confervicola]